MAGEDRIPLVSGIVVALINIGLWGAALWLAPSEIAQGEVYRILYVHVPVVLVAFLSAAVLFGCSVAYLWRGIGARQARAWAEVGTLFTVLTLASGSIWGKPTWGTWWTWDARLTTTFILALLLGGYLLLHQAIADGRLRDRLCAILGIVIFADVPIIYKSVTWWRTLHQPPSMIREGGSTMDPQILAMLLACMAGTLVLAFWLAWFRAGNLALEEQLMGRRFQRMGG